MKLEWTESAGVLRSQVVSHDIRDEKGREIGGYAVIVRGREEGLTLRIYSTRDGSKFGAIPRGSLVFSVEEGKRLAEKKMEEQRCRVLKKRGDV